MSKNIATLIGFSAIIMWASMVGLIKYVSTMIDPTVAVTLIYTFSAIIVLIIFKIPNLKLISKKYLLWSTLLFVAFEICFSFAIAYSQNSQQAIEIGIINYLWPSFTIIAFVAMKELKFNFFIIIGLFLSIYGIIFIQTPDGTFDIHGLIANFYQNPLSYSLAFAGAIIWAIYCVITKKMSNGHNPISIFFIFVALTLWAKLFLSNQLTLPPIDFSTYMYIFFAASAVGLGYAAWNIGLIHGNIPTLIVASYFTPVISSVMSMFILQTQLSFSFWQGTLMVTIGSLICWVSTNWSVFKSLLKRRRNIH